MLLLAAFMCITSCSSDDGNEQAPATLDKTLITLYVDETATLTYSEGHCEWSSDNDLVAEVKNGIVTAKHVGTTTIHANTLACSVIVKPKYTMYVEPYTEWGASISTIQNKMSGYTFRGSTDSSNGGETYAYEGKGKTNAYVYIFNEGKLTSSGFHVNLLDAINLSDFLIERYVIIDINEENKNDYRVYMSTVDMKTVVAMNLTSSGAIVLYMPFPESNTKATSGDEMKQRIKEATSIINDQL